MKKYCIIFLLLIFNSQDFFAQESPFSHEINYEVVYDLAVQHPEQALEMADSLTKYAGDKIFKINGLMLSAGLWTRIDEPVKSIDYAKQALKIAEAAASPADMLQINLFLSEQYRQMFLYNRGKMYLEKSGQMLERLQSEEDKIYYRARVYHEEALYLAMNGDYQESAELLRHVILLYDVLMPARDVKDWKTAALNLEATCFIQLDQEENAFDKLYKALEFSQGSSPVKVEETTKTYLSLGRLFLKNQETDSAKVYYQKAESLILGQNKRPLEIDLYRNLKEFYRQQNDFEQYMTYVDLYDSLSKVEQNAQNRHINQLAEFPVKTTVTEAAGKKKWKLPALGPWKPYAIGLLLFLLGLGLSYLLFKRKKDYASVAVEPKAVSHQTLEKAADKELSDENIEKISRKLKEFEAAQKFLDKEMSYSTLVGEVETNEKYLNRFFKEVLQTNYNNYINGLRIKYMVDRLKADENWRSYKLTFLAEECGFSSYSAFTANFKNIMKESPSNYLSKLK